MTQHGAVSRAVYLPRGVGWYDFYNGKYHLGGQTLEASAPYERMPLFVRAGSVIPLGPTLQYTDEKPAKEITLLVYAGADASFELYEDEGTNYNYEQGKFSTITFTYHDDTRALHIGNRQGAFEGMLASRAFHIIYVRPEKPQGTDTQWNVTATTTYTGTEQRIQLE